MTFQLRTFVFAVESLDLQDMRVRLQYAQYWNEQYELTRLLVESNVSLLSEADVRQMRMMRKFALDVSEMLFAFSDALQPESTESFCTRLRNY